jgi:hypothetical protein
MRISAITILNGSVQFVNGDTDLSCITCLPPRNITGRELLITGALDYSARLDPVRGGSGVAGHRVVRSAIGIGKENLVVILRKYFGPARPRFRVKSKTS